eukprot:641857-Pyramimonas_sp.AAC.1
MDSLLDLGLIQTQPQTFSTRSVSCPSESSGHQKSQAHAIPFLPGRLNIVISCCLVGCQIALRRYSLMAAAAAMMRT